MVKTTVDANHNVKAHLIPEKHFKPVTMASYVSLIKHSPIKPLLGALDFILSAVLVGPCVIGVWRGTWQLLDIYSQYFPPWPSFIFSVLVHVLFDISQGYLADIFAKHTDNPLRKYFNMGVMRVYTYVFMVVCNMNWRAGWILFDEYLGVHSRGHYALMEGSGPLLISTGLAILCLMGLKGVINCMSLPLVICMDKREDVFIFPTRFKRQMDQKTSLYILDCLFSVLVIGTLVVFVWRGLWAVFDMLIFPENVEYSNWTSLVLGYTTVVLAFLLQPVMKWICDRLNGATRLLVADLFLIFSLLGTVNVWRAIWNLLNLYLLPDNMELSCWITHWGCLIILILLGCSNSLLVRGVYIDAEEPAGKCVIFPCYYFRVIFHEKKRKREKQQNELKNVTENNHVVNIPENNHTEST